MESHKRMELVDMLLVEATHHMELLAHALAAQEVAQVQTHSTVAGMPRSPAQYNLQAEKEWWEKAHHGLTVAKNALDQIAQSERQRGVLSSRVGA
jgi:hypothetical protein